MDKLDGGATMKHLWECKHAYYCNNGNYFSPDEGQRFETFADFLEEFGDSDFDMNLLFRWDWSEDGEDGDAAYNGDDNYRNGLLNIYWMGQRKGYYFYSEIEVCRADEVAVIEFMRPRFEHLIKLWMPFFISPPAKEKFDETNG